MKISKLTLFRSIQKRSHYLMFRVFFTNLTIFVNNLTQFVLIWVIVDAAVRWENASSHCRAQIWTLLSSVFSGNLHFFMKKSEKYDILENSCQYNIVRRPHFFLWFLNKKHNITKSDIKGKSNTNCLWLCSFCSVF